MVNGSDINMHTSTHPHLICVELLFHARTTPRNRLSTSVEIQWLTNILTKRGNDARLLKERSAALQIHLRDISVTILLKPKSGANAINCIS
ncbi:unnamed protein product [Litomosoides sigmodontis]|uniref:Uncharacterized protein n=1 Tax=Litomosoides sigmodontis TaxID=42156 RepID=A0A3P6V6S9_LITSI|nr:unnamed protein product [Litomosoides sigmodontis]